MGHGNRSNDEFMSEINMTPLVDVMLVLLIVMMVTASFAVSQSFQVTLPKASTGSTEQQPLALVVDANGGWHMNGEVTDRQRLAERLMAVRSQGAAPNVVVAADAATRHQQVVGAMDFLRSEGVVRISISVASGE